MALQGTPLGSGARPPTLDVATLAHGRVRFPDVFAGRWGVMLFYRAHW